uniref:Uncharacterized protein TCIL3000_3_2740 n=1 Tax=Trypanosoma congolense (strain IL3000) TaxID=1068625 RepID=G0UKD6_TRYCI|nr:unnamed protein product [Trypanosoma congolense IL3000]
MTLIVDDLRRLRMLVAGVYAGLGVSKAYCFTIFAEHLRNKYQMSQSEITIVSTVGTCMLYFSFPSGALFDYAGPMVVLSVGGFLGFMGFLLFGLTFDDVIKDPTVVHFSIFNALLYSGLPGLDVSTIMPLMLQFPLDRGYVVLISKTISGLGTGVLMAYFNGWFKDVNSNDTRNNNYAGFAYFLAVQLIVIVGVVLYLVRLPMYFPCAWTRKRLSAEEWSRREATQQLYINQPAPPRRLKLAVSLVLCLLVFLTTQSIITGYVKVPHGAYLALAIISVLFMASFAVVALPFQVLGRYTPVRSTDMDAIGEPLAASEQDREKGKEQDTVPVVTTAGSKAKPSPQYDGSFWQHLLTIDLWCMWLTCFGMWGTAVVMQMNAAQIYASKSGGITKSSTLTLYVTIMSVGSAIGRMSMGYLDIVLTRRQREGRGRMLTTIALPLCPLLLFIAFLLFAVLPGEALILPFFLGSLGNGAGWGCGVLAFRMMYSQDVGKHYNFGFSSGIVSTIALNYFMFGRMYDAEAHRLGTQPQCNESSCVRDQMFILMAVNIIAVGAATVAHVRFDRFTRAKLNTCNEPAADPICADSSTAPDARQSA